MKLIKVQSYFVDKETQEKVKSWNYYLKFDNGSYVAIRPSFKEDYKVLFLIAETNEAKE